MMAGIIEYFFPKKRLHSVPKHISALYRRGEITHEQALIMLANLARDPAEAKRVQASLYEQHGAKMWQHVHLKLFSDRRYTIKERFLQLMQRIWGENENESDFIKPRNKGSIVQIDYFFHGDER